MSALSPRDAAREAARAKRRAAFATPLEEAQAPATHPAWLQYALDVQKLPPAEPAEVVLVPCPTCGNRRWRLPTDAVPNQCGPACGAPLRGKVRP